MEFCTRMFVNFTMYNKFVHNLYTLVLYGVRNRSLEYSGLLFNQERSVYCCQVLYQTSCHSTDYANVMNKLDFYDLNSCRFTREKYIRLLMPSFQMIRNDQIVRDLFSFLSFDIERRSSVLLIYLKNWSFSSNAISLFDLHTPK